MQTKNAAREPELPTQHDLDSFNQKVKLANAGDRNALAWLQRFLDENPQIWRQLGNLARGVEQVWIAMISRGNSLNAECIRRQLKQLKNELVDESASVMERLQADTILATWLESKYLESLNAQTTELSVTRGIVLLRQLESAQRRHSVAMKDLVALRALIGRRDTTPTLRVFPRQRATG